jgi:hypothetical protein
MEFSNKTINIPEFKNYPPIPFKVSYIHSRETKAVVINHIDICKELYENKNINMFIVFCPSHYPRWEVVVPRMYIHHSLSQNIYSKLVKRAEMLQKLGKENKTMLIFDNILYNPDLISNLSRWYTILVVGQGVLKNSDIIFYDSWCWNSEIDREKNRLTKEVWRSMVENDVVLLQDKKGNLSWKRFDNKNIKQLHLLLISNEKERRFIL